ncbi:MAG: putative PAS/PAC sensor protein [Elusimicrobia bacterium]|nr:MAG: putative PAS/PAC sensor protein [Elusimicrobiota bacterium]KAF0155169.1 MAG: putative PAS/PAC sensor protein [Elusimicrobiota bacterium]
MDTIFEKTAFMRHALDAVPSILMVVDEDVRVLYRNKAARSLLSGDKIYSRRAGDVMHCMHSSDAPGGCGTGPHCADCVLRGSVNSAFSGKPVVRASTEVRVSVKGRELVLPALISASPFTMAGRMYALVVMEDISELAELRSVLPICASCKKIRSEEGGWEPVEAYIRSRIPGSPLSHGLCPDCLKKHYPAHSD